VPKELSSMRLLSATAGPIGSLDVFDARLRAARLTDALTWGDRPVLEPTFGLSEDDLALIEHGRDVLARWRRKR
jgi:hypothetical protein